MLRHAAQDLVKKRSYENERVDKPQPYAKHKGEGNKARYTMSTTTAVVICTVVPLLLSGFLNYFAHKPWILYFPLLGIATCILYFGHLAIRSLDRPPSVPSDVQINSIDALSEGGRKLQRIFAAPSGNIPDDEPDRWLEKVQLCLRSISRYGRMTRPVSPAVTTRGRPSAEVEESLWSMGARLTDSN